MVSAKTRPIVTVTWYDVEQWVHKIACKIEAMPPGTKPVSVVPVARGGLIPGVMLAHRLGIIDVWPIIASSYKGQKRGKVNLNIADRLIELQGDRYLVVDDICDSGATIKAVREKMHLACFATLLSATADPNFWAQDANPDYWYEFPWERGVLKRPELQPNVT